MLKTALTTISVLTLLASSPAAFARTEFSAKRFLACENRLLKHEKLAIAIDKEEKQDSPDTVKIADMEKNLARVDRFTDKHCTGFTALN